MNRNRYDCTGKKMPLNAEIILRTVAGLGGKQKRLRVPLFTRLSRASDFFTGETIRVDGGYAIR